MSITADPPLAPASAGGPTPGRKQKPGPLWQCLQAAASLRLTVVLFVLSFILVFLGTLAQIDYGIGTVTKGYFRSWVVFIPFQVFVQFLQKFFDLHPSWRVPGSFPFPAGLTLGFLLTINLLAAHAIRFKLSWRRSGIIVLHAGLLLLLAAEFITYAWAVEGKMVIEEDQSSNVVFHSSGMELAIVDPSGKEDEVAVVPARLMRPGKTIRDERLPFDLKVEEWYANHRTRAAEEGEKNLADQGFGRTEIAVRTKEVSGVASDQRPDYPALYATLLDKVTGKEMGTWLFSSRWKPQEVAVGGKKHQVSLRFKETRRPFTLTLLKFSFDRYPLTNKAYNFSSLVRLQDPGLGIDEEILIRMNEPLRHRGETFFQADWITEETDEFGNKKGKEIGTVLQVVRNPGWTLPYISCVVVSLGMLAHFGIVLADFLRKRGA
ncbi:MAG: cytochrome c biogenesis protein ResB [Gemmataceae bacterium]|nr:cytochrome c biogenesis protein ResB [Gemmataceae bacterium]